MKKDMKKAIYTFIFGDYDRLKKPAVITPGWAYICFTDDQSPLPEPWVKARPRFHHTDLKKRALWHMINTHLALPEYEMTISVGGQIQINCNLDEFVEKRFREETDLMLIRHPERACVYDEAEACKWLAKDDPAIIDTQMERYREAGLPPSLGLFATGIIGRCQDPRVDRFSEFWWDEVVRGSSRDQLALPYALWHYEMGNREISELGWHQTFGNTMGADRSFSIYPHAPRAI